MTTKKDNLESFFEGVNETASNIGDKVMDLRDDATDPLTFSLALLKVASYHYGVATFAQAFKSLGDKSPSAEAVNKFVQVMRDAAVSNFIGGVEFARANLGAEPPEPESKLIVPGMIVPLGVQ